MAGLSALVLGATGATGRHILNEVLSSDRFTKIGEIGRKVTPKASLPNLEKLEQKTVDFDKIEQEGLKDGNWDVILIALGTTRKIAGSDEAFQRIDREYVINAAKAAKSDDPTRKQRLIYLSSSSANPSGMVLYSRSKGLTEQGLAELGYDDFIVFRPAFLTQATRPDSRPLEKIALMITHQLARFTDSIEIPVTTVAKSIRIAGQLGSSNIPSDLKSTESWGGTSFTVIGNAQTIKLAATQ